MSKNIDEKAKEEALKPFKEKVDLADSFIDEIRQTLGDDEASKITQSLLGLRGTITEANEIHETVVTDHLVTKERNSELLNANNDLYIKNSATLKGKSVEDETVNIDEDDALDTFVDELLGK